MAAEHSAATRRKDALPISRGGPVVQLDVEAAGPVCGTQTRGD